jgi:hypothetical protein
VTLGAAARKMESGPSPIVMNGQITPSLAHEIGQAKTSAQVHTFQGAHVDVRPPPKNRTILFVVAPLALVIGAIGGFALIRQRAATAVPDPVTTAPVVSTIAPPATSVPIVPTVALPQDVLVTVEATPERAGIWLGDEKLGDAPGPVRIKRSDAKVKLAIKAPGHVPQDVEVTPNENTVVSVKLAKKVAPAIPTHTPASREIENPFK